MKFKSILDGIETILKADADTKGVIKVYRRDSPEMGIRATPFCVLGITEDIRIAKAFLGDATGSHPRVWDGDIGILLLGRAYDVPSRHTEMAETLDTLQHNTFVALNKDLTLSGNVLNSRVDRIKKVRYSEEYFGYAITISIMKNE